MSKNIAKLKNQILSQGTTKQWTGQGRGSVEANAEDMAKILDGIGITDIKQFGKVDKYEPVKQTGLKWNGKSVQNPRPGVFYVTESVEAGDGFNYVRRDLTPQEAKQVKPVYGVQIGTDDYNEPIYRTIDAKNITEKNGKLVGITGQTFGNKVTGKGVPNTYTTRQTGNAWGGTYAGKGNTGYRVDFAPDGTPVFYTTGHSSKDAFLTNMAPMIALALPFAAPALAGSIGATIAGGASAATQTAIGNAIIRGVMSEATGGDFLKGAALSGLNSVAGNVIQPGISDALGGGATGNIASNALVGGVMSELSGGDFVQGALTSGIGAGINQASNELKSFSAYTPNADGTFTYQWDDGSQITIDKQANVLGYIPSGEFASTPVASQQAQKDIQNKLNTLSIAKTLTPYAVTALLAKNAYDTATQDDQGNYQYSVVPIPTDWRSPEYNMAFTPSEAIDFGSPEMLAGTQWASQPNVAIAQQPMGVSTLINTLNAQQAAQMPQLGMNQVVGSVNDVPTSINDVISNLGQNAMQPFDMSQNIGELNNVPASLNSIIAGIQSQYG